MPQFWTLSTVVKAVFIFTICLLSGTCNEIGDGLVVIGGKEGGVGVSDAIEDGVGVTDQLQAYERLGETRRRTERREYS